MEVTQELRKELADVDQTVYELRQFCKAAKLTQGQRRRLEHIAREHEYRCRRLRNLLS